MNKEIELLKKLIARTEDEAELVDLQKQLIAAQKAEAKAEARAELMAEIEKKAMDEAKAASTMAKIPDNREPVVKVHNVELFQGYNMNKAVSTLQRDGAIPYKMRAKAKADPKQAELACMFMANKLAQAQKHPMNADVAKGMTEGTTTAGGWLTPQEQNMAVLEYIRDMSIAMQDCQHISMSSDSMVIPAENAKVSVAYTAEAVDVTETTPSIAQVTLTAKRLDGYTNVTNELLQDDASQPGGIVARLTAQFVEAIGQKIDSTVFIGTGDPVSGIFRSTGASEVFTSGSTNFSELLESNIRNVIADIRPNRRGNAKFYAATSVLWQYIKGLKDTTGRELYVDTFLSGGGPLQMLQGYPVREGNDDIMPSTSAATTGFIVFGDLSGFLIGDRLAQMSLFVDPYSLSMSYQTKFLMFTRWAFAHALNNYYSRIVTA